jgi:L-cysteine:1D-myo-inositol 2-amino-2-deoxy-alpha-D-glucopyranoside ligase
MSIKYLGPRIDIHGGGSDLVFPHHTCEIAQSENATGERPFVSIWMHCAMVGLDGEKMSKSLGNLILARDLLNHCGADAIRVMLLSHHYRTPWEYSEREMREKAVFTERLRLAEREFIAAMEDDLDTPRALDVLARLARYAQESSSSAAQVTLRRLAGTLGLTGAAR